jgi:hypothetical protein
MCFPEARTVTIALREFDSAVETVTAYAGFAAKNRSGATDSSLHHATPLSAHVSRMHEHGKRCKLTRRAKTAFWDCP